MYNFLAIIIQMRHDVQNTLKTYWLNAELLFTPFYTNIMKHDRFLHILRFLNQPDKNGKNYERVWKMGTLFHQLNDVYGKFYCPSEHSAVNEINVLFKRRVTFKQYIPKK
jgi:hypothetical protein